MTVLTSLDNRHLRLARSLMQPKDRQKRGLYRLEGIKIVCEALEAGAPIEFVLFAPQVAAREEGRSLLAGLEAKGILYHAVAEKAWSGLSTTVTPQGVLAVVRQQEPELLDLWRRSPDGFFLIIDGIQDPGNAGTLLRTAAAAGCDGVIALAGTVDFYGDKAVRAAAGGQFYVPLVTRVEPSHLIVAARATDTALVLAVPTGGQHYACFKWSRPLALIVANEGRGPRTEIARTVRQRVTVPMRRGESLNVAVAAAVLLFEATRQRGPGE